MDDFEKNFPEFDWKNTPAYKHPLGRDCPCPKHEYIREQISIAKNLSESKSNNKHRAQITLKFCPDHYNVYFKEVIPSMPLKHRLMTKFALKSWSYYNSENTLYAIRSMFLLQIWVRRI